MGDVHQLGSAGLRFVSMSRSCGDVCAGSSNDDKVNVPAAPGSPITALVLSTIHGVWGFDEVYLYAAPITGFERFPKVALHSVVLRQEVPKHFGSHEQAVFWEFCGLFGHDNVCFFERHSSPASSMKGAALIGTYACKDVFGYKIADVVEGWMKQRSDPYYLSNSVLAMAVLKACKVRTAVDDYFRGAVGEIRLMCDQIELERRAAHVATATAVGSAAAVVMCTIQ